MLGSINYELSDVSPKFEDLVYSSIGCNSVMPVSQVEDVITGIIPIRDFDQALRLLLWFGFLGVSTSDDGGQLFAHNVRYNLSKINSILKSGRAQLVVHPAFRTSLGCQ